MKAIVAMSINRVIGRDGQMPWHLPDDLRWFKQTTLGHAVLMGHKTFKSIGRPLPGRVNLVASREGEIAVPGVITVSDLESFDFSTNTLPSVWVIGGAEIYTQMLPRCSELILTLVKRVVEDGDAFFPKFESDFECVEITRRQPEFEVRRYRNRSLRVD